MRDLFGSTKYIKFGVLETILSSSNAVNDLLNLEDNKTLDEEYSFLDYLSNLDSYLYGIILLPPEDLSKIKTWINNYINYLYIPLIKKDSLYLVKSKFIGEIFKLRIGSSRIDLKVKSLCMSVLKSLEKDVSDLKKDIENKLENLVNDEQIIEYLKIYKSIYNDLYFIKKIIYENNKLN